MYCIANKKANTMHYNEPQQKCQRRPYASEASSRSSTWRLKRKPVRGSRPQGYNASPSKWHTKKSPSCRLWYLMSTWPGKERNPVQSTLHALYSTWELMAAWQSASLLPSLPSKSPTTFYQGLHLPPHTYRFHAPGQEYSTRCTARTKQTLQTSRMLACVLACLLACSVALRVWIL